MPLRVTPRPREQIEAMAESIKIEFTAFSGAKQGAESKGGDGPSTMVVFAAPGLKLAEAAKASLGAEGEALVARAAAAAKFKGKLGAALDIVAPAGLSADRLIVVGVGSDKPDAESDDKAKADKGKPFSLANLGGTVAGKIGRGTRALVVLDIPRESSERPAEAAAEFAMGLRLRDYRFDAYKTKKKKDETDDDGATRVTIAVVDPAAAEAATGARNAIADGIITARTLVNEPPNVLYPESFADRAKELESLGLEVEILDVPAMEKLGMGAILGVSQGSARPGRIVVMRWNGASKTDGQAEKPVAFIGKGVTFDTGGISIKPSSGMEDMKGDMAGAACVVGLMQALAGRKAKVDAIGAIGVVENMPGAKRPAAGRYRHLDVGPDDRDHQHRRRRAALVLGRTWCWYIQGQVQAEVSWSISRPLTGAILVALGQEYAGLFSNDDELSDKLVAAGQGDGREGPGRMPLGARPTTRSSIRSSPT